jgi:hypothetical protein
MNDRRYLPGISACQGDYFRCGRGGKKEEKVTEMHHSGAAAPKQRRD